MTITEFLLARIAEDEAVALAALPGSWEVGENPDYGFEEGIWDNSEPVNDIVVMRNYPEDGQDWPRGRHIARHDPARVLAECAAKRAIIAEVTSWGHRYIDEDTWYSCGLAVSTWDDEDNEPGSGCSNEAVRGRLHLCPRSTPAPHPQTTRRRLQRPPGLSAGMGPRSG